MNIISNNNYSKWRGKKIVEKKRSENTMEEIKSRIPHLSGFANINVIMIVVFAAIGSFYVYSMNGSAMQGYKIKEIEKEIEELKGEEDKLMIREAELNSLYRLEEEGRNLDMHEVGDVIYVREDNPVALR
ncbi:hypothetical protein ACFL08_05035 [Patescibacteria group bacterium]